MALDPAPSAQRGIQRWQAKPQGWRCSSRPEARAAGRRRRGLYELRQPWDHDLPVAHGVFIQPLTTVDAIAVAFIRADVRRAVAGPRSYRIEAKRKRENAADSQYPRASCPSIIPRELPSKSVRTHNSLVKKRSCQTVCPFLEVAHPRCRIEGYPARPGRASYREGEP